MSLSHVMTTLNYSQPKEMFPTGRIGFDLETLAPTDEGPRPANPRDPHEMPVYDAREAGDAVSLHGNGFTLTRCPTAVTDFYDAGQLERIYYPEIKEMLTSVVGAEEVLLFGHIRRKEGRQHTADTSQDDIVNGPHIDFDGPSVRQFISDLAGPEAGARLAGKRFININVWRGISTVERMPLGVCDAATVDVDALIPTDIRNPVGPSKAVKTGYQVPYSPDHRWYYYPEMEPDEVLLFKIFDSDESVPQRVPHGGFVDPTSRPDAAPRHSVELRSICILPD